MHHQSHPSLPDVDESNESGRVVINAYPTLIHFLLFHTTRHIYTSHTGPGEAVVQLAEALINIESVSGREQRMGKALQGWLVKRGWKVTLQPVPPVPGIEEVSKIGFAPPFPFPPF